MKVIAARQRPSGMSRRPQSSGRATDAPNESAARIQRIRSMLIDRSYQAERSVQGRPRTMPQEDLRDAIWAQKRRRPRGTSRGRRLGGWSCGGALVGSVHRELLGGGELGLDLLDRQAANREGEQLEQKRNR